MACLLIGTARRSQTFDPHHDDFVTSGKAEHRTGADQRRRAVDDAAIDAQSSALTQVLGSGT